MGKLLRKSLKNYFNISSRERQYDKIERVAENTELSVWAKRRNLAEEVHK